MSMKQSRFRRIALVWSSAVLFVWLSASHATPVTPPAVPQVTETINAAQRVTLAGNTNPLVARGTNLGTVASNYPMAHMQLLLQRSPEREQALGQFIEQLHDKSSPSFHQWLTAAQFGTLYGPLQQDIDTVTNWLKSNGFTVGTVYPSGLLIDFSGTAGQVQQAFDTEIANFNVNGTTYLSNVNDPSVPAAIASVVKGIVSLNNYFPRPQMHKYEDTQWSAMRQARSGNGLSKFLGLSDFTFADSNGTKYFIAPGDFNTIYNVYPVWNAGYRGAGQTVAVIENTMMYSPDWQTFRQAFGLSGFAGSFTQVSPTPVSGANNCFPSVNGDESEAALDAEWAGAAAPDADILLAECNDTTTTFGGMIAAQNLLNGVSPPPILSLSYGLCEAGSGSALNAAFYTMWQQAVTEGTTVFVSAGDQGATVCSAEYPAAPFGIGVSGFASTPYNVAVGGTDFRDVADGTTTTYWNGGNDTFGGSAISYVPEVPWNDSCAGSVLIDYLVNQGTLTSSDPVAFCNSKMTRTDGLVTLASGSGGPSGCATGAPANPGFVGGTCAGYAKPSWQSGVIGIPNDGVRGIPDVSLFASNGFWSHAMWFCNSDYTEGGGTCDYANDPQDAELVNAAGGTSFSAPAFAGIQALINQVAGDRQGNMNVLLYQLAAQEYGSTANPNAAGLGSCNANNGNSIGTHCIFQDVTSGDMVVPCIFGQPNCYTTTASTSSNCDQYPCGVLSSTVPPSSTGAYSAGQGWDFATGLGSVNVANLVAAVPSAMPAAALHFNMEPNGSYVAGEAIPVSVSVVNSLSQVVTSDNSSVVTLTLPSCGGVRIWTQTVSNGVAMFAEEVRLYTPTTGMQLTATTTSGTLIPATSTPFDIQTNPDLVFHNDFETCTP
jgi:subtilase family serine protease